MTDESLFQAYIDGNQSALEVLIARYNDSLVRVITGKVNDASAAEDVAQVAWMKVIRFCDRFDSGQGPFRTWLFVIANNLAVDFLRAQTRRTKHWTTYADISDDTMEAVAEGVQTETPTPYQDAVKSEERQRVNRVLATLPEIKRNSVVALYMEGRNCRDAAREAGMNHVRFWRNAQRGLAEIEALLSFDAWDSHFASATTEERAADYAG